MTADRTRSPARGSGPSNADRPADDLGTDEMADRPLPASLSLHAASGVLWTITQKFGVRVTSLVTLVILARQVGVEDFGVVAAAAVYLNSLYVIADLGFVSYIVQAERLDRRLLSTAVWFSAGAGTALAGLTMLAAPFLGQASVCRISVPCCKVSLRQSSSPLWPELPWRCCGAGWRSVRWRFRRSLPPFPHRSWQWCWR